MMAIKRYILPILLALIFCIGFSLPVQASNQVLIGGYADALNNADTAEYNGISSGWGWNATIGFRQHIVASTGKIKNLYIELSTAVTGDVTDSYSFTLMYDGSPSSLTCSIATGSSSGSDTLHEIDVVAGKTIAIKCISSGSPTNTPTAQWSMMFSGTTAKESNLMALVYCSTSVSNYSGLQSGIANTATEADCRQVIPTAGVISNLYVVLDADPGTSPDTYGITLRVGSGGGAMASTTLTCNITADSTTGSDLVNAITVAAGDLVTIQITPYNTPSVAPHAAVGMRFTSSIDGESLILGNTSVNLSATAVRYTSLVTPWDIYGWSATETGWQQLAQVCTFKKLYVILNGTPFNDSHVADNYTFTVRLNAGSPVDGLVAVVTSDVVTGNDITHTISIANGDNIDLMSTPASTPTVRDAYWGMVCYIAPMGFKHSFGTIIGN